ncbi:MAG: peptidoglycan-binding protein [Rhizobiales bacterium]|nr:peptidoglycan-binding protein [Hyphomicrobiales bacterium]
MPRRSTPMDDDEDLIEAECPDWRLRLRQWIVRHPRDTVAFLAAFIATGTIAVNALFLQSGPHPAPLFALRQVMPGPGALDRADPLPRPRPLANDLPRAEPRTRAELVADIQRGLAKRGLYDGAVDGIYGPRTDAAVRDFAQAAHLKVGSEPNEALLNSILHSDIKEIQPAPAASMSRLRSDPIADLIGPSSRILSVQRALTDFGYGQIKPTGIPGPETVSAIEKFERARRLPVTGQVSERLMRELAAVTGRPLE